jgi:hypothetical protein
MNSTGDSHLGILPCQQHYEVYQLFTEIRLFIGINEVNLGLRRKFDLSIEILKKFSLGLNENIATKSHHAQVIEGKENVNIDFLFVIILFRRNETHFTRW